MFVCYLDDSDNTFGPAMGIAGYYTSVEAWIKFEREVEPFLKSWGISVLRGKDFHNGHNDFKDWDGDKKSIFVDELFTVAKRHVISGVNSTVDKSYFRKLRVSEPSLKNISPLGVTFGSAVFAITTKYHAQRIPADILRVSFIVERGNKNNDDLVRYYHHLKTNFPYPERLGALSFVDKHDCRGIQLADFLAFHGRREADRWYAGRHDEKFSSGDAMKIMTKHIYVRHNRMYDNGQPLTQSDMSSGIPDVMNAFAIPKGGLK